METTEAPSLTELVRPEVLQNANTHLWPSAASFEWWRRKHRRALQEANAVFEINGRTFLHAARAVGVALAEGAKQAASRSGA